MEAGGWEPGVPGADEVEGQEVWVGEWIRDPLDHPGGARVGGGGRHAGNEPDSAGDIVGGEELKAVASVGGFDSDRAGWFSPPPPPPFYSMRGS